MVESDPAAGYIVTLLSTTDPPNQQPLKAHGLTWRLFSASEVLLGTVIVIGHNVFHVVPNEVPILFVLGLVSVRVRDGVWSAIGFRRPESWLRLVLIALAAAVLRIVQKERLRVEEAAADDRRYREKRRPRAHEIGANQKFHAKIFLSSPVARKRRSIAPCASIIFSSVSR